MDSSSPPAQGRAVWLLSAGHMITDMTQGSLPALLPLLPFTHIVYAGWLVSALAVTSSVVQPLFGFYADRIAKPWLMPLGLVLTGLGMSLVGLHAPFWLIALLVGICGLGVAAFHPEAARLANSTAGANKATAMSIFSSGGNVGFALGPLLVMFLLHQFGLTGTLWMALPCLLMAAVLMTQLRQFAAPPHSAKHVTMSAGEDAWGPFAWLSLAVICRSIVFYGFITLLPFYWDRVLHQAGYAGGALALLFMVGAAGTLLGGKMADRVGFKLTMILGFALSIPFFLLLVNTLNPLIAAAALVCIGLTFYLPFSAMVVVGQQYLPNRIGLSSGVTLGLSVSIGGLLAPTLGKLADQHGLPFALKVVALLPIVALIVVSTLPAVRKPVLLPAIEPATA